MEEEVESQGVEEQVETQGQEESGTGINPAWNEFLEVLPSSLHSVATPHLQKWDQNFQSKIQEVHSQYEPYKAYQEFLDNNVPVDRLKYAHEVLERIETDPESVINAIKAYMGENNEQGLEDNENGPAAQPDESDLPDLFQHPEFKKMQDMVNQMAQIMVQQREAKLEQESEAEYQKEFKAAQEKFGELDEEYILAKLLQNENWSVMQAAEAYAKWRDGQEQALLQKIRKPGPPVLDNGGAVPQQGIEPKSLDRKGRTGLVAQMLQQAKSQAD